MYGGERNEKTDKPKQQVLIQALWESTFLTVQDLTPIQRFANESWVYEIWDAEFNFINGFVYGECDKPKTESDPCEPKGFIVNQKVCGAVG